MVAPNIRPKIMKKINKCNVQFLTFQLINSNSHIFYTIIKKKKKFFLGFLVKNYAQ